MCAFVDENHTGDSCHGQIMVKFNVFFSASREHASSSTLDAGAISLT